MDYKRLGERIREERLRLHLTQARLVEDVDISDTYMGAIERGERSLTLDTLVRLVNRLGVTVDYLLCREDRRFLDISALSDEEAAAVCSLVELLKKRAGPAASDI